MANLVWQPLALVHRFAFGFPISIMTLMVYDRLMVEAHRHHRELMEGKTMCRLDHNEALQNYAISMFAMPKKTLKFYCYCMTIKSKCSIQNTTYIRCCISCCIHMQWCNWKSLNFVFVCVYVLSSLCNLSLFRKHLDHFRCDYILSILFNLMLPAVSGMVKANKIIRILQMKSAKTIKQRRTSTAFRRWWAFGRICRMQTWSQITKICANAPRLFLQSD